MAKLYFNYSTMNAGKSTILLQAAHNYEERGMVPYLLTAEIDNRTGIGKIATWSCSRLRMVFIRTMIDDPCSETRFIGRCLRRGNTEISNKKNFYRSSHEYFQNQSRQNVRVNEDLDKFLSSKLCYQCLLSSIYSL